MDNNKDPDIVIEGDSSGLTVKEVVSLGKVSRKITNLFKQYLFILEDIRDNYDITTEDYFRYRKKILDIGNDAMRDVNEFIIFRKISGRKIKKILDAKNNNNC